MIATKLECGHFKALDLQEMCARCVQAELDAARAEIDRKSQQLVDKNEQVGRLLSDCVAMREALKQYADAEEDSPHKPQVARKALSTTAAGSEILEELELLRKVAEAAVDVEQMAIKKDRVDGPTADLMDALYDLEGWRKRSGG